MLSLTLGKRFPIRVLESSNWPHLLQGRKKEEEKSIQDETISQGHLVLLPRTNRHIPHQWKKSGHSPHVFSFSGIHALEEQDICWTLGFRDCSAVQWSDYAVNSFGSQQATEFSKNIYKFIYLCVYAAMWMCRDHLNCHLLRYYNSLQQSYYSY